MLQIKLDEKALSNEELVQMTKEKQKALEEAESSEKELESQIEKGTVNCLVWSLAKKTRVASDLLDSLNEMNII